MDVQSPAGCILPQITYTPVFGSSFSAALQAVSGQPQTLSFVFPPTSKPRFSQQATRNDVFSTAGNRQTVVQRINQTFPITMSNILDGADADAWNQFLAWALTGGEFVYFPDATNPDNSDTCFMVDTTAQLVFVSTGIWSLSCTFQVEIS
jgi:hypothetical protein